MLPPKSTRRSIAKEPKGANVAGMTIAARPARRSAARSRSRWVSHCSGCTTPPIGSRVELEEVVTGEHVEEGHEWDDREDPPGELAHEPDVPPEQQVDPDQHHCDGMQDAKDQLEDLLHDLLPPCLAEAVDLSASE